MEHVGNDDVLILNNPAGRPGANGGRTYVPDECESAAHLMQMVNAFEISQDLHVTAKLGIADLLAEPRRARRSGTLRAPRPSH